MDRQLQDNIKLVIFIFVFILCIFLLRALFPVVTLIIIALLVVYLLTPLTGLLIRLRLPDSVAAGLVFLFLLFIIFLIFYFLPPFLFSQISWLARYIATDFRQYIAYLFEQLDSLDQLYGLNLVEQLTNGIISVIESVPSYLLRWSQSIYTIRIPLLGEIWSFLGLLFLILFLMLDMRKIKTAFISLFPTTRRNEVLNIATMIDTQVGVYLHGNILRCSIVGMATYVGLALIGMPFAFILGLASGLLNIIYKIGPILAAIPAILLSLTPDTPHPLLVTGLYIIIQTSDHFFLSPKMVGNAVDLRPTTVILAILCGARLMGILGIIIAIPAAAICKVLLDHFYIKRQGLGIRD